MDNTNDKTNNPEENTPEVITQNEVELVDLEPTEESMETSDETETTAEEDSAPAGPSHSLSRLELESLIQKYMDDSEKLKSELKSHKEMYNASFENDAEYSQANDEAKAIKKKVATAKQRITQQPAVQVASDKMEEIKSEIKDVQDAISGLAEQYQNVAGTNQIVQDDGKVLEIVRNYRVIRKSS